MNRLLKFNNRVDEETQKTAIKLGNMSLDKLRMFGIKAIEITEGGPRILQLESDGLVDKEKDWVISSDSITGSNYFTLRVSNIKEGTPNKELLESLNYEWINITKFGFIELGRVQPDVYSGSVSSVSERKIMYADGKEYMTLQHRVIIFNREGDLVVDTVSEFEKKLIECNYNRGQFECMQEYNRHIGDVRATLIDNIMKYGYNNSKYECEVDFDANQGYLSEMFEMRVTGITEFNNIMGYDIVLIGDLSSSNAPFVSFAVFHGNSVIAYGKNTIARMLSRAEWECLETYYGYTPVCLIAEDSVVAVDVISKMLLHFKQRIPSNNERINMFTDSFVENIIEELKQLQRKLAM